MTLTDEQKRWITWGCGEIRRTTHGCGTWDQPGTHKAITDILGTWTFLAAMDHAFAHARDPKARTPYAMRGSKPNLEPATTARFPMRAGDPNECRIHKGEHRDHCSSCHADAKVQHPPTPPRVPPPGDWDGLTGLEQFRQARQELDLRHALTPSIEEEA